MLRLFTVGAIVAWSIVNCAAQSCLDTTKEVDCKNCDFSANKKDAEDSDYDGYVNNILPDNWNGKGFVALSGNRPWGGIKTLGDVPYLGLYCPTHSIGRTFENLTPGKEYFLTFYAAERKNYAGDAELLTVKVNGQAVLNKISPLEVFTRHICTFTADEFGHAAVEFVNDSPADTHGCSADAKALGNGVATVFFTLLSIFPARDCGVGASCHNPLPPATAFTCRCDAGDLIGAAVEGGAATCTGTDDLPAQMAEVQAQVGAVERSFGGLSDDVDGLKTALKTATLEASTHADDMKSLQDRMTGVESKVDDIQKQMADLLAALKVGNVPSSALAVPSEGGTGGAGADIPEIVADGEGGLNFQVRSGKRVTVNGDSLLTANDVTELIERAVKAALQNVVG